MNSSNGNQMQYNKPDERYDHQSRTVLGKSQTPKLIQWTMKYSGGMIKNEKQASLALVALIAVIFVVAIIILSSGPNQPTSGSVPIGEIVPS